MATINELQDALVNAHNAGDTQAANQLADAIVAMNNQPAQPAPAPATTSSDTLIAAAKELPRQLGLSARHLVEGGADFIGTVTDPVIKAINGVMPTPQATTQDLITGNRPQPRQFATMHDVGNMVSNAIGLPEPQNATERVVGDASRMLVGTGGLMKGAEALGNLVNSPVVKGVAQNMMVRPGLQAAGAIGSGTAGGAAREADAPPAVQFGASLLGGLGVPVGTAGIESLYNKARNAVSGNLPQSSQFVVPPSKSNPGIVNNLLEGYAGKLTTGQAASLKNQQVINDLVKSDLGIPSNVPASVDVLNNIRRDAGDAYQAVKNTGNVTADKTYMDALDNIAKNYQGAAKSFPMLAKNDVVDLVDAMKTPQFEAGAGVDAIRVLRDNANSAYANGNTALGKANKEIANALEDQLSRHLDVIGAPDDLIKNFQNARQTIAKTYSAQSALNQSTGNFVGGKLAKQLEKGKPLSGGMKDVAQFAQANPTAAREMLSSAPGLSPLDYATGIIGAGASGNPLLLTAMAGRPMVRSLLLSKPYQSLLATPSAQAGYTGTPFLLTPGLLSGPEQPSDNNKRYQ
jgi:hypothetical protein